MRETSETGELEERHAVSRVIPAEPPAVFAVVSSSERHVAVDA